MIKLSKSIVGKQEADAVANVIKDIGYLGMGSVVKQFETEIELFLGATPGSCCCVNTGTSALHLAITAVTKPGDHVLVPSLTYVATYQAITAAGCIPISCDVNPNTFLIDFEDVEKRITSKCTALVYVHYASNPGDLDELYAFGRKHKLRIIEDAAHSFGCSYKGHKIGSFGDITCFSFDGIKNITSGEGGAIISQDKKVLAYVNDARLLGVINDTVQRYSNGRSWEFDVVNQGYRYHMSNIFAAIGLVQLKRLKSEFSLKRKMLKKLYLEKLRNHPDIVFQDVNNDSDIIPHIMPLRILNQKRDKISNILLKNEIQTGMHYKPNHLLSFFKTEYSLPTAESLYKELISLPLHPEISNQEIEQISTLILKNL